HHPRLHSFPTRRSSDLPEEAEALAMSLQLGREVGADLILACDPDGDRYASAIPNELGEYELLNGNQTGALITYYLLSKWQEQGRDRKSTRLNSSHVKIS